MSQLSPSSVRFDKVISHTCYPLQEVPGRSLHDYLSLPVEDYNTLDPSVVQSLGDNRFKLTPPFNDWFKINIKPEVILRIQPEPANSRVRN